MDRREFVRTTGMTVIGAQLGALEKLVGRTALRLSNDGEMPSLHGANGWLNSQPLTAAGLRGKVVLVDFWTYTCVNWLRTLPYVRAWSAKYKDQGLIVIGVHSPEFSFEKRTENGRGEGRNRGTAYPVRSASNHE